MCAPCLTTLYYCCSCTDGLRKAANHDQLKGIPWGGSDRAPTQNGCPHVKSKLLFHLMSNPPPQSHSVLDNSGNNTTTVKTLKDTSFFRSATHEISDKIFENLVVLCHQLKQHVIFVSNFGNICHSVRAQ